MHDGEVRERLKAGLREMGARHRRKEREVGENLDSGYLG